MQLRATQKSIASPTPTNAKYKKYLHQGYKIQQGHKCVVLKIMQQNLKVLKNATKQEYKKQSTEHKLKVLLEYFKSFK